MRMIFITMENVINIKSYQKFAIEFMKDNYGLILYHSTGSGKTITSLVSMYQFIENNKSNEIIIIGQKSSKKAFSDDIKKLKLDDKRFTFYTYTKIKKLIKDNLDFLQNKYIILDEVHNIRNETTANLSLITSLQFAKKIILLTATPVINYMNDLSVLINIVKQSPILPTDIRSFNACYYDLESNEIRNADVLKNKLKDCISYYDHGKNKKDYPTSKTIYKYVEMNKYQLEEYRYYIRKYFYEILDGANYYNLDFENIEHRKKNFFLSDTRQLSNTLEGSEIFPKIQEIYKTLKKGPFPAVVYSNYLGNGILSLVPLLEKSNIPYTTITGTTSNEKINFIVNNYNKNKYKILLLTSAGSESLDLKNTRQIHIMEPHWNESRIKQVIGRTIRYKSHELLDKKDRNVNIYRWTSVFPKHVSNKSADEYLINLSRKKEDILKKFNSIIIDSSIENN
jgi:superfamily II DNA or RNA helicase